MCWERVLRAWRGDARVDGIYPLGCYLPTIRHLPADLQAYSSASDIEAAFQARLVARRETGRKAVGARGT